jgi:hypothetical protein
LLAEDVGAPDDARPWRAAPGNRNERNMNPSRRLITAACLFAAISLHHASAQIEGENHLSIDFTKPHDIRADVKWMDKLNLTDKGLGWDGESNSHFDGWIITQELPIGLSWRPATGASVRLVVEPPAQSETLSNGETTTTNPGAAFVRYSSDGSNWSDWQVMPQRESQDFLPFIDRRVARSASSTQPATGPAPYPRVFSGQIEIPRIDRADYDVLHWQYMRLDVPWQSDEEATARWIVAKDPSFFQTHRPFVGYIQFLFEADFVGGQRFTHLDAEAHWGLGGKFQFPMDKSVFEPRDKIPWRFRLPARPELQTPTTRPAAAIQN